MKRMLFNATHPEELRVAIVDGQKLLDLDIESPHNQLKKGNIYKGVVTRVEPSLEAAFVEYGSERQGFLPLKEISRVYFNNYSPQTPMSQVKIQDVVKEGQELVIQVEKDERGNKGAALTTFISLAGRYLVLMPNNPKGGGISRRIEGDERSQLRDAMSSLEVPKEHALIARTAGIGKESEDLQWDLDYLLRLWEAISKAAGEHPAPFLVFQETNLVVRSIRDYFRSDISEIIIDDDEIFERATRFMNQVMPHNLIKLKRHEDTVPLFSRYQIEHQIESAYSREVRLSSGGALVIDHTEAMISIDVNSARATKGADIEETALQTNLEAAEEIARQLRIRDLGGLIVIDFIDMMASRNQRAVEKRLQEALKADRARVQVGRISRFGLLEMSRQRLRSSISESNYHTCPRCEGNGHIRSVESSALSILRILEEEALKENTEAIVAHLPLKSATYLLNEKRHEVNMIENRLGTSITIVPTNDLDTPHFKVNRLRAEDIIDHPEIPSYSKAMQTDEESEKRSRHPRAVVRKASPKTVAGQVPAVGIDSVSINKPKPKAQPASPGFFKRLITSLFGEKEGIDPDADKKKDDHAQPRTGKQQQRRRQGASKGQSRARQSQGRQRNERGNKSSDTRRGGSRQGSGERSQKRDQASGQAGGKGSGQGSQGKRSRGGQQSRSRGGRGRSKERRQDHASGNTAATDNPRQSSGNQATGQGRSSNQRSREDNRSAEKTAPEQKSDTRSQPGTAGQDDRQGDHPHGSRDGNIKQDAQEREIQQSQPPPPAAVDAPQESPDKIDTGKTEESSAAKTPGGEPLQQIETRKHAEPDGGNVQGSAGSQPASDASQDQMAQDKPASESTSEGPGAGTPIPGESQKTGQPDS
jgi:ribonuclease E